MLTQDKKYTTEDFPVNKEFGDDELFFRLITPEGEFQLQKLPFQIGKPLPDFLNCRIKGYDGKKLILGHNMPRYVSEFYADGFSKGKEFQFKITSRPNNTVSFYRLVDDNGLEFKLHEDKNALAVGQTVKCKFEYLEHDFYTLRRSKNDTQLPMVSLHDLGRVIGISGKVTEQVEKLLRQTSVLNDALSELDRGLPTWILTAARTIKEYFPRMFSDAVSAHSYEDVQNGLANYKKILLNLLEGSGFLRNIKGDERTMLQSELTAQIEQIDIYAAALEIIRKKEANKFIDKLLYNLKESGYIYHPQFKFAIMMILFRTFPELVNTSLGSIFDTLMGWPQDTWKTEPFRQAFVDQLEIYISEARQDIDNVLVPETASDSEKIEKVLTAIAIQQALVNKNDQFDMRFNLSLFYRCLSLLRQTKADTLLTKSYMALMDVHLPIDFTWSDIKEPTMMMTRASVDPPHTAKIPEGRNKYFVSDKIEVEVGENISIRRIDEDDDSPQVIPNNVLPWPGMKVYVNMDHTFTPKKIKSLEGHAKFWTNVEQALFQPKETADKYPTVRRLPEEGEYVRIEIDRAHYISPDPNHVSGFHCKIVDEQFLEGEGIMRFDQLVSYNLYGVTDGTFRNNNGRPLQFDAKVIKVDEYDNIMFSLSETVAEATRDLVEHGDSCFAVITKDNGHSYSALSERGFGLFINKDPNEEIPYRNGNVLSVTITGFVNGNVQAVADDGPFDNYAINNANALHNLLMCIAIPEDEYPDLDLDEEDMLSKEDMREIIEILRYKAVALNDDIIQAFDYLSFARLLARSLGDENLASILRSHRDILLLHQHYAKNKQIFLDDINKIDVSDSILLQRLANRLRIVACLGDSDNNQLLWQQAHKADNDTDKELAQMVLSYNLLYDINHDDPAASSIKDSIAKTLNVSSEQRNLKYYGSESQYVEFKSSLVYPAQKGRSGISMADPDKQEFEILHIIAGFMNSKGGTLYLGVNDDHYERGLEEDMKFYKLDSSERNNIYRRSIRSLDNMANYLQNIIDRSFSLGALAGDYAKVYIDDESTKGVIAVKVDPCPHVVRLDGTLYVRHGAKTSPYLRKEDIEQFEADRSLSFRQQAQTEKISKEEEERSNQANKTSAEAEGKPKEKSAPKSASAESPKSESDSILPDYSTGMHTSTVRPNILHEYQSEHFVTPSFYIRFVGDHEYVITKDEWSIPDDDKLVLAVKDDETSENLVLVYEDESVIKVPMREIMQKRENTPHTHYAGKRLIFACPMHDGDALYSLHENSKGTIYERMTMVDELPLGSMGSTPMRIMEVECEHSPLWELIPASRTHEFSNIKSSDLKRTQIGSLAKGDNTSRVSSENTAVNFYNKFK